MRAKLTLALTLTLTLALATLLLVVGQTPMASAVDIHGNDLQDTYSGVGALLLPGTTDPQARHEAATCAACEWTIGDSCDTPYGVSFLRCHSNVLRCPQGSAERRAWMRRDDGQWQDHGLLCVTGDGPPTVTTVGERARGAFVEHLPALSPAIQPAAGVVTQIPVVFDSGQAGRAVVVNTVLAGVPVHLEAHPRWSWQFGDGTSLTSEVGGARWPAVELSHTYRRPGWMTARVVTSWSAFYTVAGVGTFPVSEEVTQEATVGFQVGEGRAALAIG